MRAPAGHNVALAFPIAGIAKLLMGINAHHAIPSHQFICNTFDLADIVDRETVCDAEVEASSVRTDVTAEYSGNRARPDCGNAQIKQVRSRVTERQLRSAQPIYTDNHRHACGETREERKIVVVNNVFDDSAPLDIRKIR